MWGLGNVSLPDRRQRSSRRRWAAAALLLPTCLSIWRVLTTNRESSPEACFVAELQRPTLEVHQRCQRQRLPPRWAAPPGSRPPPGRPEEPPDPVALLRQMLSGEVPPGGPGSQGMPGGFGNLGGMGGMGGPGAAGMDPLTSLLGGGLGKQAAPKQTTDSFVVDRVPVLKRLKRPILVGFFAWSWYKGWVGNFGFFQGAFGSSYFDMLAVPLRVIPGSPFYGRPFLYPQFAVDSAVKVTHFLVKLATGKVKISDWKKKLEDLRAQAQAAQAGGTSPFGPQGGFGQQAGAASPFGQSPFGQSMWDATATPGNMPTAPTTPLQVPPLQTQPLHSVPVQDATPSPAPTSATKSTTAKTVPSRPPSKEPPPIIDAEVTFLD